MLLIISTQIIKMFFMIVVGYICVKSHVLDHNGAKAFSDVLLLVVNSFVIVNAFQVDYSNELVFGLLVAAFLALLTHLVGILISTFVISPKDNPDYQMERYSCIYSNCGFLGIPLVNSVLGNEGVIYLTSYIIVFNILIWTHGISIMSGKVSSGRELLKGLKTPAIFSIIIGLALFFLRIHLPEVIGDSFSAIAAMNTPMAMFIAGATLAETDILSALKKKSLYKILLVRLLIVPVIMIGIIALIPVPYMPAASILLGSACPVATTGTMFCLRYGGNYKYSSQIFVISTLLSLVSIPFIVFLSELVHVL